MRNEKVYLFLFLFFSITLLINPLKNFISSFFLGYLYFPAVLLKENVDKLKNWETEKLQMVKDLKQNKRSFILPSYKIYYYPLFPPYLITLSRPDGIDSINKVVLQNGNFVGIIKEIKKNRIVAKTIFSPDFKIGVIDERSKVIGVLKSNGEFILELNYIPYWADIKQGDTLLTSGIGGILPFGIPVGVIRDILQKEGEVFLKVTVKPLFDPSKASLFFIK